MQALRLRLTLLYAGVLAAGAGILLALSWWILDRHLEATLPTEYARAVADQAASQYVVSFIGLVMLAGGAGWWFAGPLLERVEASVERQRRFVANASHELRTPLTAVLGYAESIADGDMDVALAAKFAGTIGKEAGRTLRIIEDLMSLSRIEADRYVSPSDEVDLERVIRTSVDHVRLAAERCGCEIRVELEPGLPAVIGDRPQLAQLFDNLLGNAVRYGCSRPQCVVRLWAIAEKGAVRIEVSDTGPGIAREHLPFLTRRFYRVDEGRSRESGGTGLGLAIVKHIVERHRGTLRIDSAVGRGTSVTVRLPVAG